MAALEFIKKCLRSRQRGNANRIYRLGLYSMLAPYVLVGLVLIVLPMAATLVLAFFSYDAVSPPIPAGWTNFSDVKVEPLLPTALYNSLFFVVFAVPLRILGALLLALLYFRPRPGVQLYRMSVCVPTIIPEVAYALVALWVFNPFYGPLNYMLRDLGLPTPGWLADATTAKFAIVIMASFQIAEGLVVLLAGLKDIPQEYFDAAAVDGCGPCQKFYHITLPFLKPWLVLLTFRDVIMSFQNTFVPAFIMTGGGPYYGTFFLPLLVYEEAFDRFRFGVGSVIMLLVIAVTLALLLLMYRLLKGWGYDEV